MLSQEIRQNFLKFFQQKGHAIVKSSPVVPHDDPTLLFVNAGMNQFKDVFLAKTQREYVRATTSQKCIRVGGKHNDLDNVGHTSRHLTFFEMLGNFSFGNYFKADAIQFAWEVSTSVFQFDPERIWATIFETDEEAFELWKKILPEKRIVRMGEKDNFWAMGDTGPCGPCSELLFDRGTSYGSASSPKEDASGERYLEFWNLVFMQFERSGHGELTPLPKQSIDTGSGLERVVSLKMNVDSVFATDIFQALIGQIETISHKKYDSQLAPAFHVIADHIRSLSFAIADGAQPSNIERGYVLRKLLRRAVRYGRMLGMNEPFLARVLPRLIETMGTDYPELQTCRSRIADLLTTEEESFFRTLKRGGNILSSVIEQAQASPLKQITGESAFKLKDTYGFPVEEILLIAKDTGLEVNLESYQLLEEKAKELSRSAQTTHKQQVEQNIFESFAKEHGTSEFLGYDTLHAEGTIIALISNGKFVDQLHPGEEGFIVLDRTPFYAEMGGQMGDQGILFHKKAQFAVTDCQTPFPDIIVHIGRLKEGTLLLGEPVSAHVESSLRQQIANNHTATHLLHWALQEVLGEHVRQAGSLVDPSKLRFDFNHHKPLSKAERRLVEEKINAKIREDQAIATYELAYEEAQTRSDIKQFFGEKYGNQVRVIDIDFSKELCGGTHTHRTGTIGLFRILKEGSIASGVRRIEAVTGAAAEHVIYHHEDLLESLSEKLKTPVLSLPDKITALLDEQQHLIAEVKKHQQQSIRALAHELAAQEQMHGEISFIGAKVPLSADALPQLAELLMGTSSRVVVLAATSADKVQLLVRVSPSAIQRGLKAVNLIKAIAPLVDGSGGGKADLAQAGGKKPAGTDQALDAARQWLSHHT